MLYPTFQAHRSVGSSEEEFYRFLSYMGVVAILLIRKDGMNIFLFFRPVGSYINLFIIGLVPFEKMFETDIL